MSEESKQQTASQVSSASPASATPESATPAGTSRGYFNLKADTPLRNQFYAALGVGAISAIVLYFFRDNLRVEHGRMDEAEEEERRDLVVSERGEDEDEEDYELGGSMTFLEHLGELRVRMIRGLIALSLGVILCFIFVDHLIALLEDCIPKESARLIATHPVEVFMTWLKVSVVGGIFLAFPFMFYEIWMFVAPGLYKRERRLALPLAISAWICFVAGGLFCYLVVFRFALDFFAGMAGNTVENLWSLSYYLNFMVRFLLAFGIVFEEPVVILMLAKVGIVNKKTLTNFRPYAIISMFVLSAIITPPDPISQMMCAGPLLILYELSIILVGIVEKREQAGGEVGA